MEDSKKTLILVIGGAFIGFILLTSVITGTNPIESFVLMIGQTIFYIVMLVIFGAPVFVLITLISMFAGESQQKKESKESGFLSMGPAPKEVRKQIKADAKETKKEPKNKRPSKPRASTK